MTDLSTHPQTTLADFCQWWPVGEARPCYAQRGRYLVLDRGEWEAQGAATVA